MSRDSTYGEALKKSAVGLVRAGDCIPVAGDGDASQARESIFEYSEIFWNRQHG